MLTLVRIRNAMGRGITVACLPCRLFDGKVVAMQKIWYALIGDQIRGPYPATKIRQLAEVGLIKRETQLRRGREGEWITASRVKGLFPSPSEVPVAALVVDEPPKQTRKQPAIIKIAVVIAGISIFVVVVVWGTINNPTPEPVVVADPQPVAVPEPEPEPVIAAEPEPAERALDAIQYEVLDRTQLSDGSGEELVEVLVESFSRRTPVTERERIMRVIAGEENCKFVRLYCVREAMKANYSESAKRENPGVLEAGYLGDYRYGMFRTPDQPPIKPRPRPEPQFAVYTGPALYEWYDENEVRGDTELKGKMCGVCGPVVEISKAFGEAYITLPSGNEVFSVQCFFPASAERQLARLTPGDNVTVAGVAAGKSGNLVFRDCFFYENKSGIVNGMTPEERQRKLDDLTWLYRELEKAGMDSESERTMVQIRKMRGW